MLQTIQGLTMRCTDLRVPLDVVRTEGHSPRWHPFAVSRHTVTTQEGLVRVLGWCWEVSQHTSPPLALCMDENIHYRLLKLCYGQTTHRYDFHGVLRRCHPCTGCGTRTSTW